LLNINKINLITAIYGPIFKSRPFMDNQSAPLWNSGQKFIFWNQIEEMFKRVLAVILGFVTGFVLVTLIQSISAGMYPPPEDLIAQDTEALKAYFSSLPTKARYIILAAHAIGCFGAAYITSKFADNYKFYLGLLVGLMMLVAGASYNLASYSPIWAFAADIISSLCFAYLGAKWGSFSQKTA